jgi:hypothetical protein
MGCLAAHSLMASVSNTWKHVVTDAVMGEISFVEIGQISPALEASSATSQAILLGIFSCVMARGGGPGISTVNAKVQRA